MKKVIDLLLGILAALFFGLGLGLRACIGKPALVFWILAIVCMLVCLGIKEEEND